MEHTVSDEMMLSPYIALFIFILTYILVVSEKRNRAVVTMTGGLAMLILGLVEMERAFQEHIEWGTITLLVSMMMMVSIANWSGVFHYLAVKIARKTRGEPLQLFVVFSLFTAAGSALLDNVTTVMLMVPIILSIMKLLNTTPIPYLIAVILFSNIGGMATLIGDPPNIMIGGANPHLTFNDFLIHLFPVSLLVMVVTLFLLYRIFQPQLHIPREQRKQLMKLDEKHYIRDAILMKKSLIVMGLTLAGFIFHDQLNIEAPIIAAMGAVMLMFWAVDDEGIERALASVEWVTIFFFVGLFVVVGGLVDNGWMNTLASMTLDLTGGNIPLAASMILWVSGIASAVVDNIPFVATMIPFVQDMGFRLGLDPSSLEMNVLWWSLAMGACLGGNGTLIGSSANVIVAGLAMRGGYDFSFKDFMKIGIPVTLISLFMAQMYVYFRYIVAL